MIKISKKLLRPLIILSKENQFKTLHLKSVSYKTGFNHSQKILLTSSQYSKILSNINSPNILSIVSKEFGSNYHYLN